MLAGAGIASATYSVSGGLITSISLSFLVMVVVVVVVVVVVYYDYVSCEHFLLLLCRRRGNAVRLSVSDIDRVTENTIVAEQRNPQ